MILNTSSKPRLELRERRPASVEIQVRALALVAGLVAAVALALFLGLVLAKRALFVEGGPRHADVIVVLGGDPDGRVFQALKLYRSGAAPKILISGDGDCYIVRDHFLLAGVSSNALIIEPNSGNTMENAEFSARVMKEHGMKSAIVVTSWYHCRRAMSCFHYFGRGIAFSSYPTYDAPTMDHNPGTYDLPHVFREYPALLWYVVRYRIPPTCELAKG